MSRRVLSIVLSLVMVLNISFTNGMLYASENDNLSEALQENEYENNESHFNDEEQIIFDSIVSEEDEEDLNNIEPETEIISNGLDNEELEEDEVITTEFDDGNDIEEDLSNIEPEADIISNGLDNEEPVEDEVITTEFDDSIDIEEDDELSESESYYNSEVILYNEIDENETNINESTTVSQTDTIIESTQDSSDVVEESFIISTSSIVLDDENMVDNVALFGAGETYTINFSDDIAKVLDDDNNLSDLKMEITNLNSTESLPTNDQITGIKSGYQLAWWTYGQTRYGKKVVSGNNYVQKAVKDIPNNKFNDENCITLNAVWNIKIKFDANGHGTSPGWKWVQQYFKPNDDDDEYYKNNVFDNIDYIPKMTDLDGYHFLGWSINAQATNVNGALYKNLNKPITLYAIWQEQSAKITLNVEGGTIDNNKVKTIEPEVIWEQDGNNYTFNKPYSKELILPTSDCISKKGHKFLGWYNEDKIGGSYLKVAANTKDERKYHAKWEANTYSIDYVLNSGSFKDESSIKKSIKYDEEYTLPTNNDIVRTGYVFKGWYTDSEFSKDNKIIEIEKYKDNNHILFAKWEISEYEIKYGYYDNNNNWIYINNSSDGVIFNNNYPQKRYINDEIVLPTADDITVKKVGDGDSATYQLFKGWKEKSNQNGPYVTSISADTTPSSGNTHEFVADWYDAYKVTIRVKNDESIKFVKKGDTIDKKYEFPTSEHSKFKEWHIGSGDDETVFDFNQPITENIEITAFFENDNFETKKVKFQTQINNIPSTVNNSPDDQYIVVGEKARKPLINPTAEGYEFLGWYYEGLEIPFDFNNTPINTNIKIYAKWNRIEYNITYNLNNGNWSDGYTAPISFNVENKNNINLPKVDVYSNIENLKRAHYKFNGWYERADFIGTEIKSLDKAKDIVLYAKWDFQQHENTTFNTINFVPNDATGFMATQYIISTETNYINKNVFTKEGYNFIGWSSSDGKAYNDGQQIDISEDIILTAIWQQKPQQIITPNNRRGSEYWGGGGTGGGGGGVSYSPSMNVPATIHNNQMMQNSPTNTESPRLVGFNNSAQNRVNTIKSVSGILDGRTSQWVSDSQTGKWKLYNANGIQAWNGFYQLSNVKKVGTSQRLVNDTYYFDQYGQMVTGWVQTADNNWYYFETQKTENEGKMITGWKQINGDYYYFRNDGTMVTNGLTPDGRIVGADGKLLKFNM